MYAQDKVKAMEWTRKAAAQGHEGAQNNLKNMQQQDLGTAGNTGTGDQGNTQNYGTAPNPGGSPSPFRRILKIAVAIVIIIAILGSCAGYF